ncbi:hypothetical protein BROUX41_004032 [Berkeleyomyces rouxiae]|uniref:uncharacterized protein n=1 Tax=Berkeleyomyces rouxiae TaxID=2035830 RepID=UPI003B79FA74
MGSDDKRKGGLDGSSPPPLDSAGGPSEPPPAFDEAISSEPLSENSLRPGDLPPQYTEILNSDFPQQTSELAPFNPPFVRPLAKYLKWFTSDCYLDPQLDSDPKFLEAWVRHVARQPVRMHIRISGQHTETRMHMHREGDGHSRSRTHSETVEDFDFEIDMTAFLFSDVRSQTSWAELRTVENHEKVHRGGIFRSRAHPFRGVKKLWRRQRRFWADRRRSPMLGDEDGGEDSEHAAILHSESTPPMSLDEDHHDAVLEGAERGLVLGAEVKPTLTEWCHRYCSSGLVRTFNLEKRVVGFDESYARTRITNMIRATGYMGDVSVNFPVDQARMTVYSSCYTNEWRLTKWLRWLVIMLLLVVIVWPYLFLRTRKFDVVRVDWFFSRVDQNTGVRSFVSMSEDLILDFWQYAIQDAAMRKRKGELHAGDAVSAQQNHNRGQGAETYRDMQGRMQSAFYAAAAMQRHTGWGRHS